MHRCLLPARASTSDATDGYIIVWQPGVDGATLTQELCTELAASESTADGGGDTNSSSALPTRRSLNCTASYQHVINGFAGG
jgi:hypothetical protein